MKLLSGREEIIYLLTKVIDTYEKTTKKKINRNTNRKNYTQIAKVLSNISNDLPATHLEKQHDEYEQVSINKQLSYPYRKYDITGGQVKDAFKGIVENPRPYLVDACYIYLYGVGRKGFELKPIDENLIDKNPPNATTTNSSPQIKKDLGKKTVFKTNYFLVILLALATLGYGLWYLKLQEIKTLKNDLTPISYLPSTAEINYLEGIWSYYTSAPQARSNKKDRYQKVVNNVIEIKYKNGYFLFTRHGATINHYGYMQYMSPEIISINSYVKKTKEGYLKSPSHSLAKINKDEDSFNAISATWSFESDNNNQIIGVRNVYVKEGSTGSIMEIKNTPENTFCHCKIIRWTKNTTEFKDFELKYQKLENMSERFLQPLLDEKSILLREPNENVILTQPHRIK